MTDLHRQFEIPGVARIVPGNGGLPKIRITTADASAEMYLHGAQVTSWTPAGAEEVLFLSERSRWENGRAIRGGIPICSPWFGNKADDAAAPAHGLVRTREWQLDSIVRDADSVVVSMSIKNEEAARRWWPGDFRLTYRVTFGAALRLELVLANTGAAPARFEAALHTYFRIGDIATARVTGLDQHRYLDKVDAGRERVEPGEVRIAGETDRIYLDTRGPVEVIDPTLQRRIRIAQQHALTTVIWNPWQRKAQSLADLGDDEWTGLLCVESCNVSPLAVDMAQGQQHTMGALITVAAGSASDVS